MIAEYLGVEEIKESKVTKAILAGGGKLDDLGKIIEVLKERLSPIMGISNLGESPMKADPTPPNMDCPLVARIDMLFDKVVSFNAEIKEIVDRLEI